MQVTHEQLVDALRGIHARRGGTPALLNLLRAGEVRGGSDVLLLSEMVSDQQLKLDLAHHAMDEARHAFILLRRMQELGYNPTRVPHDLDRLETLWERSRMRDVRHVYSDRGTIGEAEMMEFTALAIIPERDAATKLRANHEALAGDPPTQAVIMSILRDEERHMAYLEAWLERFARRFSPRAVASTRERLEAVYREMDAVYYAGLQDYFAAAAA